MAANVKVKAKLHHNSMEMEIFRDVHVKIFESNSITLGALHSLSYGYIIRKVMEDLVLKKLAIMMI